MEQKESNILKESKLTRQNSGLRKISISARKDSEKSMKEVDGSEVVSNRQNFGDPGDNMGQTVSPKVPRKIINNWRQACDKTKDKTKELLKKWRTMPEAGQMETEGVTSLDEPSVNTASSGWSEHVWNWGKKSSEEDGIHPCGSVLTLTEFQRAKFAHFFIFFLDLDRDDVISLADFEAFSEFSPFLTTLPLKKLQRLVTMLEKTLKLITFFEDYFPPFGGKRKVFSANDAAVFEMRLRHFSGWSKTSTEYKRLMEVQRGFIELFLLPEELQDTIHSYELLEKKLNKEQLSLDKWIEKWNQLLEKSRNYLELPLWLQYFPKILFNVMNRSGTGIITKDELSAFYISILGLTATQLEGFIGNAYKALTSNEEKPLSYSTFRLCFANFLMARFPNGPGQYLFGPISSAKVTCFPIDYKALCSATEDLEQYSPVVKTNRRSVIV